MEDTGKALLSRYAPYLDYPKARYSVGIMDSGDGAKITAMRNPWRRFRSVPLGQIFSHYGGGGHQRVASVLLKDRQEAQQTLGSILNDLRSASAKSMPREAVSGD
jgi:nanoRNase/pAp phosphatase (c-di-AMP/oligoRNAs hydrolase)